MSDPTSLLLDPLKFAALCWPDVKFYDKQVEIIRSVVENDETVVPAGNMLGKDFIAAFISLWFFCSRKPCRVVTSSVDGPQLKGVLWGEIRRFIQTSKVPLPIKENDLLIRHVNVDGSLDGLSYLIGRVTQKGEGLLGHHVARTDERPRTLFVGDEASGLDDETYKAACTWSHRRLIIGNPYPCTNFFRNAVKDGDILRDKELGGYHRRIIKIKAEESPNVRLGERAVALGKPVPSRNIVPGVIDYREYRARRKLWDPIRQSIGLDAEFYEGAEVLLYPPQWLNRAERVARLVALLTKRSRRRKAMGVDSAEGGDSSVWTIIDDLGIIRQVSLKTRNTIDIPGRTIAYIHEYGIEPKNVVFDRGGGGKQHADNLRDKGYDVRTVGFGEAASLPEPNPYNGKDDKRDEKETRYVYKNRRAEMYGLLRLCLEPPREAELIDEDGTPIAKVPTSNRTVSKTNELGDELTTESISARGFGIPSELVELRRQLAPLPLLYDIEGRLYLPPKDKPSPSYKGQTIKSILGRSPDEADSLVLALFGLLVKPKEVIVGAMDLSVD